MASWVECPKKYNTAREYLDRCIRAFSNTRHQPCLSKKGMGKMADKFKGKSDSSRVRHHARPAILTAESHINTQIGQRLKSARVSRGVAQAALARELNISFQQIQKYETGISSISAARLSTIAGLLDYPVNYFLKDVSISDSNLSISVNFQRKVDKLTKILLDFNTYENLEKDDIRRLFKRIIDLL